MPFGSSLNGSTATGSGDEHSEANGGSSDGHNSMIRRRNHKQQQQQNGALQRPLRAKVVVLGSMGVGKTSILLRHDGHGFTSKMSATLGASYISSRSKIQNGRDFELQIWDTAGQERFRSMIPLYLRNTSAAVLVFDITNRQSFRELDTWIKDIERSDDSGGQIQLFLIGNKCDLGELRSVSEQEARQFAEQRRAHYFETSALSGRGIETAMQTIAEDILQAEQRALKERQGDELAHSSFNLAASEADDDLSSTGMDENNDSGADGGKRRRKKGNGAGCCAIL